MLPSQLLREFEVQIKQLREEYKRLCDENKQLHDEKTRSQNRVIEVFQKFRNY